MKTVAFLIFFFIPLSFFAQTGKPAPEFNGVKVDSTLEYCVKQYVSKGFGVDKKDENVVFLHGVLGADDIKVFILATPNSKKVWKVYVTFPDLTTWSSLKGKFQSVKELLQNKYGTPKNDYHFFSKPYEEGDGYEMTGVAVEKCTYFTFWEKPENNAVISVEITKFNHVAVSYENITNVALNKKEKDKATSDGL